MFIKIKYISITPDFIVNEKQMKVSKEWKCGKVTNIDF